MTDDEVTIHEVHRVLCGVSDRLDAFYKEFRDESHSVRGKIQAQEVAIAKLPCVLHTEKIDRIVEERSGMRQWIASVVVGLVVALWAWLLHFWER